MRKRTARSGWSLAALAVLAAASALFQALAADTSARVPVETLELDNGMKLLLVRRPELASVMLGWVAHVGSSNERPGMTGITHLFEHMMFKGTRTIGTKDIERDLQIIAEQEKIQERIRAIYDEQRLRWRRGEISDPFDPANRTAELAALEKEFQALVEEQRSLMVKDEFDKIYTAAGGSRLNAFTNKDITVYIASLPSNKIELWFWMESDRLREPVFREFYSERDVVHEERRLRTESTPTGRFDEELTSMIWQSHPYSWPIVGWPSDLRVISKAQADDYFATYYAPNNITAALVGNFDPEQVKALARRYFGRIPRGPRTPPPVVTMEMPQLAEKRMLAECDCQPQVSIAYHTVPFRHKDSYALSVLAGLLNGQTGRLNKALVLGKQIATTASTSQDSMKWDGSFTFSAESKGSATPDELEAAWNEELRKIQEETVPAAELQKVKNQIAANAFRRLENPFGLMVQLLMYDGLGDWTYIQDWSEKTQTVTAEDVMRVAKVYLTAGNRTVGIYNRKAGSPGAEEIPPEIAGLPDEIRPMMQQRLRELRQMVSSISDPAQLEQMLGAAQQRMEAAPEPMRKAMPLFIKAIQDRLDDLKKGAAGQPGSQKGGNQ